MTQYILEEWWTPTQYLMFFRTGSQVVAKFIGGWGWEDVTDGSFLHEWFVSSHLMDVFHYLSRVSLHGFQALLK